jgi:multidrug efflux pump subunit AcrA (membrane-fusion protein)
MAEPRLKPNLDANREEKDGRTYYRLVDPTSGREYRLYEVEYFIAQMLDGATSIATVAARARDELKFELSPNDLERFVKELSALGFLVEGPGEQVASPAMLSADDIMEVSDSEVDKMTVVDELDRLVRSALLHVKQGLIAQGRDYFLAAKKYAPSDERVGTMLNHLDVVGEDDGPSDIEYLWKQAVVLYPEITQEIGPPGVGVTPIPIEDGRDGLRGKGAAGKKVVWAALGVVVFGAIGFAGWTFVGKDLLNPPPVVSTEKVRTQKVNLYYTGEVLDVGPRKNVPLRFDKGGVVAEVLVRAGEVVKKHQPIARLKLSPADEKQLAILRQKRQSAEKSSLDLASTIDKLQADIKAKNDEVAALSERLKAEGKDKTKAAPLKKKQASLKKDVAAIKKKLALPQKNQKKEQKAFEAARAAETAFANKAGSAFLEAPDDGTISKLGIEAGAKAEEKTVIATLADPSAVHVRFKVGDGRMRTLPKDAKLKLVFGDGMQTDAFVVSADEKALVVEAVDGEGELAKAEKTSFKLVRETIEAALIVNVAARVSESAAYVIENGYAVRRPVEWVEVRGKEAIARKGLQVGELVVVGPAATLQTMNEPRERVTLMEALK